MKSAPAFLLVVVLSGRAVLATDKLDVEYGVTGGEGLRLDAHCPDGPGPYPMVVIVHGGGWSSGDKQKDISVLFGPLSKSNFAWFSINYRLAPTNRWPACLEDTEAAIRWVKAHAKDYKGNPQRMAVLGYSAGGQLACLAAVLARHDAQVQAVVGVAAPTDMVADTERRGGLSKSLQMLLGRETVDDQTRALLREMSPINYIKRGLPPFLLIQGDADKTVHYEQSLNFQAKLRENGVPCELVTVKGAPHRITEWDKFDPSYKEKLVAWLEEKLAAKK